jgi:hypothetical protein
MKYLKVTVLLMAATLIGCQSTNSDEVLVKESNAKVSNSEGNKQTREDKQITDLEIAKLAKKTSFSPKELRIAARELGYRCVMVEKTGTHIKKRVCSTKEQRDIQDEAARQFLKNHQRGGVLPDLG